MNLLLGIVYVTHHIGSSKNADMGMDISYFNGSEPILIT